jgi:small GTP-binding protein
MVATYRHRLVVLRSELEDRRARRKLSTGGPTYSLPKEGAGQVVLVGLASSGKSTLLNRLTGAKARVGSYGFTTQLPEPGVLKFGGSGIQVIEMPALFEGAEESSVGRQILGGIRNADLIVLVIDLSKLPVPQMEFLIGMLEKSRIRLNKNPPPIRFVKTGSGGFQIIGQTHFHGDPDLIHQLLHMRRVHNCSLHFRGPATLDDLVEVVDSRTRYAPAIVIGTKGDAEDSSTRFKELCEQYGGDFEIFAVSVEKDRGIEAAAGGIFRGLGVIRVYTRKASGEVADKPIILPEGALVEELAARLHSDFLVSFRYAIVFREGGRMKRKKVGLAFRLEDQDVTQIFTGGR